MTFLNPLLLLGLAAAAIPLIIHLFNFRRPQKIDFSSLEFLKELQKSTMQRVRIKQLLLLMLRMLAIACLALAFARPTLQSGLGSLGKRANSSMAIVIDNSRSMQLRDAQGAYLDQAKDLARALVEQTDSGDEIFIYTTNESGVNAASYNLKNLAQDAIDDIEISPASDHLSAAWMRAATEVLDASNINKEVYLISDLQERTFADSTARMGMDGVRTYLLPVGERTQNNVAITRVEVVSRIIEVGQPVRLEATLVNYGAEPIEGYVASVFLDGERVAQASEDLQPRIPKQLSFTVTPQQRGWLAGLVQIEDDAFGSDNIRHFTLHVPEERQLLIVQGEGQQTDFLELALSPELTRGRVAFQVETIQEGRLPMQRLGTYDAVILVGPRSLSSGEISSLKTYVEGGGGVLFFPGEGAIAQDYNGFLSALGGGKFSGFSGSKTSNQPIASFDRVDLEHPLFEGVFDQQQGFRQQISVEDPLIYYVMNYSPARGAENTLIALSNGFPFLQEVRSGNGGIFLLGVAPDLQWSDLPQRGLFIPLIYRCMYYLSSNDGGVTDQFVIGAPGEIRLSGLAETASASLVAPDGEEIVPEQRKLLGATLLELDETAQTPGIYDVRSGDSQVRTVALNLDVRESDLSRLASDVAVDQLAGEAGAEVRLLDTAAAGDVSRAMELLQEERTGVELWNVFLLLALIFLVAEMLVAKQWRPEAVPA
ncbi:MAG: BatA domain-containing protein [Bacteroidota bacterium]